MGSRRRAGTGWATFRCWPVIVAVLGLMLPLTANAAEAKGVYWTRLDVVFLPPPTAAAGNPLRSDSQDIVQFAAVIQRLAITKSSKPPLQTNGASLYTTGIRNGYSVYLPNSGTQWQPSFPRAVISIEVVAEDAASVTRVAGELADKIASEAVRQQDAMGVIPSAHISTESSPSIANVSYHPASPMKAVAALLVLALGISAAAAHIADRLAMYQRHNPKEAAKAEPAGEVPVA